MNQVLARSINTSLVAILPILSILVIGAWVLGATALQDFGLALFVGLTDRCLLVDLHRLAAAGAAQGARASLRRDPPAAGRDADRPVPAHHPGGRGHGRPERGGRGGGGPGRGGPLGPPGRRREARRTAAGGRTDAPAVDGGRRRRQRRRRTSRQRDGRGRAGPPPTAPAPVPRGAFAGAGRAAAVPAGGPSADGRHGPDVKPRPRQPAAASTAQEGPAPLTSRPPAAPAAAAPGDGPVGACGRPGRPIVAGRSDRDPVRWRYGGTPGWLKDLIRDIPDFPQPGVVFKDITPLLADADGPELVRRGPGRRLRSITPIDKVIGIEARGFIVAAPVAVHLGAGFVPVRKAGKLPWQVTRRGLRPGIRSRLPRDPPGCRAARASGC